MSEEESRKENIETLEGYDIKNKEALEWNWRGWFFFLIGKLELAEKCFDKSLELNPKDLYGWGGRFWTIFNLGKLEEFFKDEKIEKLVKAYPENEDFIRYCGSYEYYVLGEFDKALEWLDKWIELEKRKDVSKDMNSTSSFRISDWYTTIKSYLLFVLEKYDEALTYVDKALEEHPSNKYLDDSYVSLLKGRILNSLGRFEEAIKCYDEFIDKKMRPDVWINEEISQNALNFDEVWSDYALTLKGNALSSLGRYDEAISCYNKALEISIEKTRLPAVVLYNKSCILFPEDAKAWQSRVTSALSDLEVESILAYHEKWLENAPNNTYAWTWKGIIFSNLGKYDEAVKCYNKALEVNPNYALAWNNKGNALASLGKYDEAIKCYNKALEVNPNYALAQTNKNILIDNKMIKEEKKSIKQ